MTLHWLLCFPGRLDQPEVSTAPTGSGRTAIPDKADRSGIPDRADRTGSLDRADPGRAHRWHSDQTGPLRAGRAW